MPSTTENRPAFKLEWLLAAILLLVVWIQFSNTLGHGYAWDDSIAITENPRVQKGLAGIPEHFQFRDRQILADFNGYRPLTFTTFSIDIALFGDNPQAAHTMQVFYFSILCMFIFFTLKKIFTGYHPIYAFLAALLFAVHPLHVEVVANIKSRDEILALLFGLLSLRFFIYFVRQPKILHGALSLFLFVLAMLSKEGSIAILGIMAVCAWIFGESNKQKLTGAGLIAGQIALVLGVFALLTGRLPGATPDETTSGFVENIIVSNSHAVDLGFFDRLMNSGYLIVLYIKDFFYPVDLVYTSGYNHIPVIEGFSLQGLLGLVAIVLLPLGGAFLTLKRKFNPVSFGFFFFFIGIFLYLHLLFPIADTKADRFMFLPSLGLCWIVVAVMPWLMRVDPAHDPVAIFKDRSAKSPLLGFLYAGLLGILFGFFVITTWNRNPIWKSTYDLVSADLPKLERCGRAHYLFANEVIKENQDALGGPELELAVTHLKYAIQQSPSLFYARIDLGKYLNLLKRDQEAVGVLQEAANMFPDHEDTHYYLGRAQYLAGDYPASIASFGRALALKPDDVGSIELLGRAYNQNKEFSKGLSLVEDAIIKYPGNVNLLDVRSDLLYDSGRVAESFDPIFRILEIQGNEPTWWKKLIGRYQLIGDDASAAQYYQLALERGVLQPQ